MANVESVEGSFSVEFPGLDEPVEFKALYGKDNFTAWIPQASIEKLGETPLKLVDLTSWLSDNLKLNKTDKAGTETPIAPEDITGGMSAPILKDIRDLFMDVDISLAELKFVSGKSFTIGVKMAPGNLELGGIKLESITVIVTINLETGV